MVVGTNLVWKQTCQIYLWHVKNMDCTLAGFYIDFYHISNLLQIDLNTKAS